MHKVAFHVLSVSILLATASCYSSGERRGSRDSSSSEVDAPPPRDLDGDGHDSLAQGGDDCDDTRPEVNPDAEEICADGIDNDCDGSIDGPVLAAPPILVTGAETESHSLAWTGSEYAVAWIEAGEEWMDRMMLTRIEAGASEALDAVEVGEVVLGGSVFLLWTGTQYALLWASTPRVLVQSCFNFARLDASGALDDTLSRIMCFDPMAGPSYTLLGVTPSAEGYLLLVVQDSHTVGTVQIGQVGQLLDPFTASLTLPDSGRDLRDLVPAQSDGALALVWLQRDELTLEKMLMLALIATDEAPGSASVRSIGTADDLNAAVAASWGTHELGVVHFEYGSGTESTLVLDRVGPAGLHISGPDPVMRAQQAETLSLAWTDGSYALAWSNRAEDGEMTLRIATMTPTGSVSPGYVDLPIEIMSLPRPDMVWTGSEIGVLYRQTPWTSSPMSLARIGLCE